MVKDFDFKLPGLGRPASSRPQRVAEAIKNELTILLLQQVGDPRLSGVTISRATVTADLKQAKIFFTVPGGAKSGPALQGMQRAKGFFRSHLAKALNLRHTPELLFAFDNLNEEAERINDLFRRIHEERKDDDLETPPTNEKPCTTARCETQDIVSAAFGEKGSDERS